MTEPTKPNGFFDDGVTPCIVLAEQRWPIPVFGVKQLRYVVPAVSRVTKAMRELSLRRLAELTPEQKAAILAQVPGDVAKIGEDNALRNRLWAITDFPVEMSREMTDEVFEALTTAVFWALRRAHPQLTFDEFEEMPIGMIDLINTIGVIADQTGMMRKADPECRPFGIGGLEPEPELPNWDDIIATIINRSGGRWEDWEDDLTVPRLEALYKSWGKEPPIAPFIAAYFGYEAPDAPDKPVNAIELFQMFPTGTISLEAAAPIMPHTGGR